MHTCMHTYMYVLCVYVTYTEIYRYIDIVYHI